MTPLLTSERNLQTTCEPTGPTQRSGRSRRSKKGHHFHCSHKSQLQSPVHSQNLRCAGPTNDQRSAGSSECSQEPRPASCCARPDPFWLPKSELHHRNFSPSPSPQHFPQPINNRLFPCGAEVPGIGGKAVDGLWFGRMREIAFWFLPCARTGSACGDSLK